MKRSIIAILAASTLSMAVVTYAGGNGHHGKHGGSHGGMRGPMFERALDLSAEQKTAIDNIYSEAKTQRKASSTDRREVRKAMMDLNPADADYQANVAAIAQQQATQVEQKILAHGEVRAKSYEILTPEQREELVEIKQEAEERMAKRHHRGDRKGK